MMRGSGERGSSCWRRALGCFLCVAFLLVGGCVHVVDLEDPDGNQGDLFSDTYPSDLSSPDADLSSDFGDDQVDMVEDDQVQPDVIHDLNDLNDQSDEGTDDGPAPDVDSDGDGLMDAWEAAAGDLSLLDPSLADTDGDGTPDGQEDPDGDGWSNLDEQLLAEAHLLPQSSAPHPFQPSLVIELDSMAERELSEAVIAMAAEIYGAISTTGPGGVQGVGLHVLMDEQGISPAVFDGSFGQRHNFLLAHGPSQLSQALPLDQLVHVVVVATRTDMPYRGGEVVTHGEGEIEATGVLIYYDALEELHPQCGFDDPYVPPITLEEALASTLAHELGHVLQLGHDTEVDGGVNTFNLMSVPSTCAQARQRFHGEGNSDTSLGATEAIGASRFSQAATSLMDFGQRLSVDTAELVNEGAGVEM